MVNWILEEVKKDNFLDLVFGFFKTKLFFPNENHLGFQNLEATSIGLILAEDNSFHMQACCRSVNPWIFRPCNGPDVKYCLFV